MEPYAVIETGGKQYRVKPGDKLRVERIAAAVGSTTELTRVLAISDGSQLRIGTPHVEGAKVISTVLEHIRGRKVVSFKKKRRKGYKRKVGHRQSLTVLKIESFA
ncbi:MAG: 50S ribosomal protein L21 [Kiritimatiellae bacterium]|nr:50S ribosomal protein L21 [Kiritimatiellia bacterium]